MNPSAHDNLPLSSFAGDRPLVDTIGQPQSTAADRASVELGGIQSANLSSAESREGLDFSLLPLDAEDLPHTPDPLVMKLGRVKAIFWNEVVSRMSSRCSDNANVVSSPPTQHTVRWCGTSSTGPANMDLSSIPPRINSSLISYGRRVRRTPSQSPISTTTRGLGLIKTPPSPYQ